MGTFPAKKHAKNKCKLNFSRKKQSLSKIAFSLFFKEFTVILYPLSIIEYYYPSQGPGNPLNGYLSGLL